MSARALPEYPALDYGADPSGKRDSTDAIISATQLHSEVLLPPGSYLVSKTIGLGPFQTASTVPVPYPSFMGTVPPGQIGDATDTSLVELVASGDFPIGDPMVALYAPNASVAPTGVRIKRLAMRCNSRASGLYVEQPRMSFFEDLSIMQAAEPAGQPNGATAAASFVALSGTAPAYNAIRHIVTTEGALDGLRHNMDSNDVISDCYDLNSVRFAMLLTGQARATSCHYEASEYGLNLAGGNGMTEVSGFDFFGLPTINTVQLSWGGSYTPDEGGQPVLITRCQFAHNPPSGAANSSSVVYVNAASVSGLWIFSACNFKSGANTPLWIAGGDSSTPLGTVLFDSCSFTGPAPSGGIGPNPGTDVQAIFRNCPGINPLTVSTPSVPAASTAVTNDTMVDCTVYVTGGAGGDTSIDGTSTGIGNGTFFVPAWSTIDLGAYTTAPTWKWIGH